MRIHAQDVVVGYRKRMRDVPVARGNFELRPGTITAAIGPNGAGKTTLLRTLLGAIPSLSGVLTLGGLAPSQYRHRYGIGYLPESVALPQHWTTEDLFCMASLGGTRLAADAIATAMDVAGIDFPVDSPVGQLSKGQRQRALMALAVVHQPDVLLLDEPEAGLDPAQRVGFRVRLRDYADRGHIVLVATHDVDGISGEAEEVIFVGRGVISKMERAVVTDRRSLLEVFRGGEG